MALARAGPQGPAIDEIQIFLDFLDLGAPFGKEIPMFGVSGTPLRALWIFLIFLIFWYPSSHGPGASRTRFPNLGGLSQLQRF